MFVLGYALPLTGLSGEHKQLFLISFYGGIGITAILALLFSCLAQLFSAKYREQPNVNYTPSITHPPASGILSVFEDVLLSSMVTLGKIGGYMIIFSLIAALLATLMPGQSLLCLIFSGLLEMTSGLALAYPAVGELSPWFVLGFITFGGLSVAAQSFSLGNLTAREQLSYLVWKLIQSASTLLLFYLLYVH